MKKIVQKRIDMYDIGDGLTLMNVICQRAGSDAPSSNRYF